jgi:hypothetical protein
MVRHFGLWMLFIIVYGISTARAVERWPTLQLIKGEQRYLRLPGIERFQISSASLQAVAPPKGSRLEDGILIRAVKDGAATVLISRTAPMDPVEIPFEVTEKSGIKTSEDQILSKVLMSIPGLEVHWIGARALIRGEIQRVQDADAVQHLVDQYPKSVVNQTEYSKKLIETFFVRLRDHFSPDLKNGKLILEESSGRVQAKIFSESERDGRNLERELKKICPGIEIEGLEFQDGLPSIHLKAYLLEVKRDSLGVLGLDWKQGEDSAVRIGANGIETPLNFQASLEALSAQNSARVLSAPELVLKSPGEAEFFAGGELPIQQKAQLFSSVTWKPFGITLKIKSEGIRLNKIKLDLNSEVSQLDPSIASENIPGIKSNRIKTQVEAEFDKPIFLSGLLSEETRQNIRALPGLGSIPILGSLFKSESYLNSQSELIAAIVAHRKPPAWGDRGFKLRLPKGPLPIPRKVVEETGLIIPADPNYPWNAFAEKAGP